MLSLYDILTTPTELAKCLTFPLFGPQGDFPTFAQLLAATFSAPGNPFAADVSVVEDHTDFNWAFMVATARVDASPTLMFPQRVYGVLLVHDGTPREFVGFDTPFIISEAGVYITTVIELEAMPFQPDAIT